MNSDDPLSILIFFCLFELIGGAALGVGFRSILHRNLMGMFFLIWGAGFAGIPLLIGAVTFLSGGHPAYFYAQAFVLLAPIVTVILLPDDFLQSTPNGNNPYSGAIIGAVMTMIGGTVVILNLRDGVDIGLVVGGIFAVIGALVLVTTLVGALRSA